MDLETPDFEFKPHTDERPRMDEPLPVELEAVGDLRAPVPKCDRAKLDHLYLDILEFAPIPDSPHLAYQADNFALHFSLQIEERSDYRPIRIIVRSIAATEPKLLEAEIEYTRQKSVIPGHEALVFQDPDGNWLEVRDHREIG